MPRHKAKPPVMKLNFKSTLLLAASIITLSASAQNRTLPPAHNAAHDALIADQRNVNGSLKADIDNRAAASITERERLDEIYNNYWNSQSVNPYGNIAIPAREDINVATGIVPVPGRVTSKYGWRAQFGRMHRGVDLQLSVGDTVRSAFPGKVRLCKYEAAGYGYYVVVRHDNGMETVYGHLSKFLVKPDMRVEAGQPIALGGNTGRSTGPHLHFETRFLGLAVNPEGIFDFEHHCTIKDVYTFDKASYQRSQVTGPRKSTASKGNTGTRKQTTTASKKQTKKQTTTKKRSTRRK